MNRFATGVKKNYYGKGDVIVYRLNRDGSQPEGEKLRSLRQRHDPDLWRCLLAYLYDG